MLDLCVATHFALLQIVHIFVDFQIVEENGWQKRVRNIIHGYIIKKRRKNATNLVGIHNFIAKTDGNQEIEAINLTIFDTFCFSIALGERNNPSSQLA